MVASRSRVLLDIERRAVEPMRTLPYALVSLAIASLFAERASAQPVDAAARRRLLGQAQQARERGEHTQALYFAEQAGRLQWTSSVRRFVAEEQQALGRLPEAASSARLCVREAEAEPPSANHAVVLDGCQRLQAQFDAQLGRVRVVLQGTIVEGLQLELAERAISPNALTESFYVVPGRITTRAVVQGLSPSEQSVVVAAGQQVVVTIAVPARATAVVAPDPPQPPARAQLTITGVTPGASLRVDETERDPAAMPIDLSLGSHRVIVVRPGFRQFVRNVALTSAGPAALAIPPLEPIAPAERVERGWSAVGPVIAGVGAAMLVGSAATWAASEGAYGSLRARCATSGCPGDEMAQRDASTIRTLDAATTGLLISGAIVTAAGTALVFVVRPERRVIIAPTVATAGLSVSGTM
ncbi:MAG: hypothetical protein JNK05_04460 [Myxococcales bacterium]|nr:hypothetical protein [Myxococcales bacterium]